MRLAMTRGTRFSDRIDNNSRFIKVFTTNYEQSLVLLKAGRVDAVIGTSVSLDYLLKYTGEPEGGMAPPLIINSKSLALYCHKSVLDDERLERLRTIVKRMHDSGEIRSVFNDYLEKKTNLLN